MRVSVFCNFAFIWFLLLTTLLVFSLFFLYRISIYLLLLLRVCVFVLLTSYSSHPTWERKLPWPKFSVYVLFGDLCVIGVMIGSSPQSANITNCPYCYRTLTIIVLLILAYIIILNLFAITLLILSSTKQMQDKELERFFCYLSISSIALFQFVL